ncbi:DUF4350 domain-containing protein [Haladaptatus sp. NG-SE-30]
MRDAPFGRSYPQLVLAGLTCLAILGLIVAASTSATSFGAYNAAWDGATGLRTVASDAGASPEIIHNTSAYTKANPNETVAVILSPDRPYQQTEQQHLRQFVQRGGTLVVAEDYGEHSNALLASIGATARIDGRPLRDERHHYRSPAMPIARNASNHTLVTNVSALTLNHGSAVTPGNATTLVRASEYAYLDTNRNEALDENETLASSPVATIERVGEGRVIVVSDPSMMINVMLDQPGNHAFVTHVFAQQEHVLLDYSHTAQLPPLALAVLILRDSAFLQTGVGLLGVLAVFVWFQRPDVVSQLRSTVTRSSAVDSPTMDDEAMISYLNRHHPDWESDRLQRVVQSLHDRRNE